MKPYNCLGNSAICQEESKIIFAWGRDAQGMQLPEGMRMCVLRSCCVLPHCAVLPANNLDALSESERIIVSGGCVHSLAC